MAIIKRTLTAGTKSTSEQLARLRKAAKYPIVYTEDCPELTDEQLAEFRPVNGMTWEERAAALREAGLTAPVEPPRELITSGAEA